MGIYKILLLGTILVSACGSFADPNDFVNPKYVVAAKNDGTTRNARDRIVRDGRNSAKQGPWTITNNQVRASSGDPRDYLSWAPYHWPNCNWCRKAKAVNNEPADSDTQEQQVRSQSDSSEGKLSNGLSDVPGQNNGSAYFFQRLKRQVDYNDAFRAAPNFSLGLGLLDMMGDIFDLFLGVEEQGLATSEVAPTPVLERLESIKSEVDKFARMPHTNSGSPTSHGSSTGIGAEETKSIETGGRHHTHRPVGRDLTPIETPTSLPHTSVATPLAPLDPTTSSTASSSDLEESLLRAPRPTKTKSCTSSPTRSMPPQSTWSSCPYKPRDGKVNPDTRDIKSSAYIGQMSQSVFWNAIAAVASGSESHEKSAVDFINTFFLDNKNKMNPKVEFGQVVRGPPGTQAGSYMGILDMRSLVKVVNAVLVLRETQSPYWTQDRDDKMTNWARQYVRWVETSPVGQKAERAANNHGSFYPNQIAALKILSGDIAGAKQALQLYFDNQFQDQIVASGEQPLEAVRTRPFHYRCFNLEAIITNAKLGDYIGINYWSVRTKYGATIQTAVDYIISLDPGNERVEEALPHVAAVAAVYGDPRHKYANYLKSINRNYDKKPFWFYDQPAAILNRPKGKRDAEAIASPSTTDGVSETISTRTSPRGPTPSTDSGASSEPQSVEAAGVDQDHPPEMFANGRLVELEEGFFVGWDEVREFYRKVRQSIRQRAHESEQTIPPPPIFQDGKEVELEDGLDADWDDVSPLHSSSTTTTSV